MKNMDIMKKGVVCVHILLICMLSFSMVLSGCSSRGGRTYKDSEVRTMQRVPQGPVTDVTEVRV